MNRTQTLAALMVGIISLPILSASADSVTYTGTVTPGILGGNIATSLNMFNTGLGTLTGVQVTLDFSATPYASIVNYSGTNRTFTASDSVTHSYNPSDIWTISYGTDSWTLAAPTVTTGPIFGSGQVVANFATLDFVGGTSAPADLTAASGLDFAAYEGLGSLTFFGTDGVGQDSATGPFFTSGGGGGGGADLAGTASVTYSYISSVPEPTTLAMLGLGGLALILRKRRQS